MAIADSTGGCEVAPAKRSRKRSPKPLEAHKRACAKYERKTKQGFLMRAYRNMLSRVTGVQKLKHHLYVGKELLPREDFYAWSLANQSFHALFDRWLAAGHVRTIAPSVDRINAALGYVLGNIRWVEFSENCRNIQNRTRKPLATKAQRPLFR